MEAGKRLNANARAYPAADHRSPAPCLPEVRPTGLKFRASGTLTHQAPTLTLPRSRGRGWEGVASAARRVRVLPRSEFPAALVRTTARWLSLPEYIVGECGATGGGRHAV